MPGIFRQAVKSIHSGVLLILFNLLLSASGFAESLIILGNENKPPKIYRDSNGRSHGILPEIMKYVADRSDHQIEINLYPWARAYQNALDGKGAIIGLSKTTERLALFDYSVVVYHDQIMMVVLKGHTFDFHTMNDLDGKLIGIGRSGSYGDEFEQAKRNKVFVTLEDNNPTQRLRRLLLGRIDVALIGPGKAAFTAIVKNHKDLLLNQTRFEILSTPLKNDPNYLGIAKSMDQSEFLQTFNLIINQGYQNGEIQKIIDQYSAQ